VSGSDDARRHALRLESLWRLSTDPRLRGNDFIRALLLEAVVSLAPGRTSFCLLRHRDGSHYLVDAVVGDPGPADNLRLSEPVPFDRAPEAQTETTFAAAGRTYELIAGFLDGATAVALGPEDATYIEILGWVLARQIDLETNEDLLRREEVRSRAHAERLASLWQISNSPHLRDADLWTAMLAQAGANIRPDQYFRGTLWRVQEHDIVIEATSVRVGDDGGNDRISVGQALPRDEMIVGAFLKLGERTRSFTDVRESACYRDATRSRNVRSFLVTTFTIGGAIWGLSFASDTLVTAPLNAQDEAYIEVLAAFFGNRVQQRWQFDRIQYQQSHDVLTGLLNRSQFRSLARSAIATAEGFAVIVIDVNQFREVNETYGHMIGDALLVEIAAALQERAVVSELVGRIGANTFAVFAPDASSPDDARRRASRYALSFARAFSTGEREGRELVARTASFGVALDATGESTLDVVLSHAETALQQAKAREGGAIVVYEPWMDGDSERRALLSNELMAAIAGDQFVLVYQPHVELGTGRVSGAEALIRWQHPTRGLLTPDAFIPFAEQTGIITRIDAWVMAKACSVAAQFAAERPGFRLYFNLSGRQAGNTGLVRDFVAAARAGVDLRTLGVEITESDAMRNVAATRRVCRALRRLGVKIAIDDFGTGYSSLSSLQRLAVDVVKIDRAFVSGVLDDPHDGAITETIMAICQRFGFASLAEGAETDAEVSWLRQRGCTYVQGYAIARPLAIDDFRRWLAEHAAAGAVHHS
jgi:diguanylate cyclase (GGDEF)-like protein